MRDLTAAELADRASDYATGRDAAAEADTELLRETVENGEFTPAQAAEQLPDEPDKWAAIAADEPRALLPHRNEVGHAFRRLRTATPAPDRLGDDSYASQAVPSLSRSSRE